MKNKIKHKIKVGQKLWLYECDKWRNRKDAKFSEVTVCKVSRLYFWLEEIGPPFGYGYGAISKETLECDNANVLYRCYINEEDYYNEVERKELVAKIIKNLETNAEKYSLEDLRNFAKIIEEL